MATAQAKAQALEAVEQATRAQAEAVSTTTAQIDAVLKALEDAGPVKVSAGVLAVLLAIRALVGALEAVKPLLLPSLLAFVGLFEAYLATEISANLPFLGNALEVYTNLLGLTAVTVAGGYLYLQASSIAKAAADGVAKMTSSTVSELKSTLPTDSPLDSLAIENPFRPPDERSYVNRVKGQQGKAKDATRGRKKKN